MTDDKIDWRVKKKKEPKPQLTFSQDFLIHYGRYPTDKDLMEYTEFMKMDKWYLFSLRQLRCDPSPKALRQSGKVHKDSLSAIAE